MSPDDFQEAWKAESSRTRVKVDAELLRKQVEHAHQDFRTMILMRDFREAGVALVMIPLWFYLGSATSQPWTWYLMVPALIWITGFIIVDRMRYKQRPGRPGDSLLKSAAESVRQVEHQIWLLRNIFWWYLLPCTIGLLAYFTHVALLISQSWLGAAGTATLPTLFVLALYYFIYYTNQRAVRNQLEPRRQELLALLAGLGDDTRGVVNDEFPILTGLKPKPCSRRGMVVASIGAMALFAIGAGTYIYLASLDNGYPKLAPFTDVRWGEDTPVVEIDGEWNRLFSIDGIATGDIIAYCKRTYPNKWQKRFAEDLVEVLTGMGHPPGSIVRLDVQNTVPQATRLEKEVAMTAANRRAVRAAAERRETVQALQEASKHDVENRSAATPPSDPSAALIESLEAIRAAYKLPAMAAFALRDGAIIEQATVGARSNEDDTPVGDSAQWHLGSNTKAMTATVAGMLVEEGLLRWASTIGEVLGEVAPNMNAEHRETTLAMLLQHLGGITPNINWFSAPEDRVACAAEILSLPPKQRGEYAYSNGGYVVAGAMMEVVTGKRWEDLMRERLFEPLGMNDTGFGAPLGPGAPWGHERGLFGWTPKSPAARNADNAPVLGPAGTVHTTLEDYARFIEAHLKGAQGESGIVSAETFARLHTPSEGGAYAMGWIVTERDWAGGRALTHGGSNTLWFATVWIAPETDMAFFAVTNAGGDTAFKAVDEGVELLIQRQLGYKSAR